MWKAINIIIQVDMGCICIINVDQCHQFKLLKKMVEIKLKHIHMMLLLFDYIWCANQRYTES